jgi:catechol 2,3-dioxygenase-like lactoylglutathione lyase family enzyme
MEESIPRFHVRALTIICTDPQKSAAFYRDVLGAAPLPTDNGIGDWFRLGTLEITLLPNASEHSPATFPTHAMPVLWLEVENLKAAAEQFARQGVSVVDAGDGQFMMIADPDGLVIEVWQDQQLE